MHKDHSLTLFLSDADISVDISMTGEKRYSLISTPRIDYASEAYIFCKTCNVILTNTALEDWDIDTH